MLLVDACVRNSTAVYCILYVAIVHCYELYFLLLCALCECCKPTKPKHVADDKLLIKICLDLFYMIFINWVFK